jgi:hypothetical protein
VSTFEPEGHDERDASRDLGMPVEFYEQEVDLILAGTPYDGGYFRVRFEFGPEYPNLPPKCMSRLSYSHLPVSQDYIFLSHQIDE